jgi:hypothetical protein
MGRAHDITRRSRRKIAHDAGFDVDAWSCSHGSSVQERCTWPGRNRQAAAWRTIGYLKGPDKTTVAVQVGTATHRITRPAPPARAEPDRASTAPGRSKPRRATRAEAVVGIQELECAAGLGRGVPGRDRQGQIARRKSGRGDDARRRIGEIPRRVFVSGKGVVGWGRALGSLGAAVGRRGSADGAGRAGSTDRG